MSIRFQVKSYDAQHLVLVDKNGKTARLNTADLPSGKKSLLDIAMAGFKDWADDKPAPVVVQALVETLTDGSYHSVSIESVQIENT